MDYPVGISESVNKIFAGILFGEITGDDPAKLGEEVANCRENLARFKANFPSNIFEDQYAIFYDLVTRLGIPVFNKNELCAVIDNNRDLILDSPYVDLTKFSRLQNGNTADDDEKIEAIKLDMVDSLVYLSNVHVSHDEFNSACAIFINYFRNQYMMNTGHAIVRIMSDSGYEEKKPNKRKRSYAGFDDAKKYYNERMKVLNELDDDNRIRTTVIDSKWYLEESQREGKEDENALLTIGLKSVDEMVGELRRSNMLGILGPPKGGKTRFSNYIVQRALSEGYNVCVWPLEGTKEEWIAMQITAYIAKQYGININSKKVLQRRYDNDNERNLVNNARLAIAADQKRGRLSFIEGVAYCEDFIDVLQTHYDNDNPFDVVVIDSLVNILSKTGRQKVDRISSSYMELKSFVANRLRKPALAIVPAQLKQDVVDHLRSHPNETIDVTSGGESAETIRSPDEVIGLFSSKEERAAGYMKIYSVASRHSGSFADLTIRTRLESCNFYEE